jgi:hypothetical protein
VHDLSAVAETSLLLFLFRALKFNIALPEIGYAAIQKRREEKSSDIGMLYNSVGTRASFNRYLNQGQSVCKSLFKAKESYFRSVCGLMYLGCNVQLGYVSKNLLAGIQKILIILYICSQIQNNLCQIIPT